ncbi:TMEM165/GDT1 family protein [Longispora sp. K20-0274]|uniref:TMEM165/GDT1 family protein n=1 Tax=Longispora sp. K20-0274 TaxID=3088255 RepID=UPI00399BEE16
MELTALGATLLLIFLVELPDKTLMATLVLASRYRPLPVLAGVSAAFAVQSAIAVAAGSVLTLLPDAVVLSAVFVLFGVGAFLLYRESRQPVDEAQNSRHEEASWWRIALTSFGVLFAAEWGDASQLATAAMAARYHAPVAVFLGAFVALVGVAAVAVLLGRAVLRYVPLRWIQRGAAALFAVFALYALYELVRLL